VKHLFSKVAIFALCGTLITGCGGLGSNSVSDSRFAKIEEVLSRVAAANERQSGGDGRTQGRSRSRESRSFDAASFMKAAKTGFVGLPKQVSREEGGDDGTNPPPTSLKDKYKVGDKIFDEVYQLHAIVDEWQVGDDGPFTGEYIQRARFRFFEDDTYSKFLFSATSSTDKNSDGSWTFANTQEVVVPIFGMDFIRTSFSNTTNFETQSSRLVTEVEAADYTYTATGETSIEGARWEGSYTLKESGDRISWLTTYSNSTNVARTLYVDSTGYSLDWTQNADGSGSFTITNSKDPLTPATATFNVEGKGVIRFADGTEKEFDLYADSIFR